MVEICSKSLVRAIVKYYSSNLARTPIKTYKGDDKWPLFVNKQLFWWSASITLDNNNAVLTGWKAFSSLYTLPHTSVSLTSCISIFFFFSFEYFDRCDHYATCWVTLTISNTSTNHNQNCRPCVQDLPFLDECLVLVLTEYGQQSTSILGAFQSGVIWIQSIIHISSSSSSNNFICCVRRKTPKTVVLQVPFLKERKEEQVIYINQ